MKIAMVVHGGVWRDARVLKEARSLAAAGHDVTVHGIGVPGPQRSEQFKVILSPEPGVSSMLGMPAQGTSARMAAAAVAVAIGALLFVALYLLAGGPFLALASTALAAVALACLLLRRNPDARRLLRVAGLRVAKPLLGSAGTAYLYRKAYEVIGNTFVGSIEAQGRPDVIHIHDQAALTRAHELKQRFRCPMVWDAHEIYEDLAHHSPARGRLNASIIRAAEDVIDRFITINDSIAAFYAGKYPRLGPATIVKNATEMMPEPVDDGRLHAACGLPAEQRILLFQGGFGPLRGLRQLIEAAPLLSPRWTIVLMGWGDLEAELRDLASGLRITGNRTTPAVVFLPPVPQSELQSWSAGASLGVIAYEDAGLNHLYCTPNKLWEYPNAGVPILATDMVEMGRMIRESGTGFLLPRNFGAQDIARTVNALGDDELAAVRRACRAFVEKDNWSLYERRLVDLYEGLRAGSRTG